MNAEKAMRVSVLFNDDAGEGVSSAELQQAIEGAGHEILRVMKKDAELDQVLADSPDLLVTAGGDGTVARAAIALAGEAVPLAILPLGTANTIARSLGIQGALPCLIEQWSHARRRTLDIGIVRTESSERRFVEAVGGGLIPAGIAAMDAGWQRDHEDALSEVARAVRKFRDVLASLEPRRCQLTIDGEHLDTELLVLEVLNIRSIGPNLELSVDADHSDGVFSVVTAGEEHRDLLVRYLEDRMAGTEQRLRIPTRPARTVEVRSAAQVHVDDQLEPWPSTSHMTLRIEAAAVQYLA
jgi:diacylglycerol kinase (ATP)